MERKIYGIFVAGGSGSRMGGDIPKQFMILDGKPVLQRSIESFTEAIPGLNVITVLPRARIDTWKRLCSEYSFDQPQRIVEGGMTRFHSVQAALAKVPDGVIVSIHDGVRPFVSGTLIREMVSRMQGGGIRALLPALSIVDTLRSTAPGEPAPDREKIVGVQTPQMFLSEDIKAAYTQAYRASFTDDGSVAESYRIPLTLCPGERLNIKITAPEDMLLAEAILSLRKTASGNSYSCNP